MTIDADRFDSIQKDSIDPLLSLVSRAKKQTEGIQKLKKVRFSAWVLYDVANTFYASGILSFISLVWIQVLGQKDGYSYEASTFFYTNVISIASIFMAIMLPILGSMSDVTQGRKNYVIFFTAVCIISTYAFIVLNSFWPVLILFAVSMVTYQWAQVFYDSMLPSLVPPGSEAKLSSIAITIGYLGGAMITAYGFYLSKNSIAPNGNPSEGVVTFGYSKEMAFAVIVGFTLLALPIFFIKEPNWGDVNKVVFLNELEEWETIYKVFLNQTDSNFNYSNEPISYWKIAKKSISELYETFQDIYRNNIGMFFYIVAYFIIADLANLIALINIAFLRDGVGLNENEIFKLVAVSGISLIVITPYIGNICDRKGAKEGYRFISYLWGISLTIMILEGLILPKVSIYVAAATIGPALSGVWVAQRQMVLELVPNEESIGRYFGLTKFSGKLSSAIGPLIFSSMFFFSRKLGYSIHTSYRWSIFALAIFLAIGFYILAKKVPNKSREFKERKLRLLHALEATDKKIDL